MRSDVVVQPRAILESLSPVVACHWDIRDDRSDGKRPTGLIYRRPLEDTAAGAALCVFQAFLWTEVTVVCRGIGLTKQGGDGSRAWA